MANLCSCGSNNGGDKQKRCYFKLLMNLMNQRYYSKLQSHIQSDQIDLEHQNQILGQGAMSDILTIHQWKQRFGKSLRIKCCKAHDKFGYQCTKPVVRLSFIKKGKEPYIPLYRCCDHIAYPPTKWEKFENNHLGECVSYLYACHHDLSVCHKYKKNIDIKKNINYQINKNNGRCKHQKPNKDPCRNCLFPIDYKNEIHFLCIKHHYKYIKSQYSLFKAEQVEFLRTILQPKMDLLTYQAIMSKISFLKLQNKSVLK
jgi:hypothetical protein